MSFVLFFTIRDPDLVKSEEEDTAQAPLIVNSANTASASDEVEGNGATTLVSVNCSCRGAVVLTQLLLLIHQDSSYMYIIRYWLKTPALLLLCVAGGVRNAGGYVWAYQVSQSCERFAARTAHADSSLQFCGAGEKLVRERTARVC